MGNINKHILAELKSLRILVLYFHKTKYRVQVGGGDGGTGGLVVYRGEN